MNEYVANIMDSVWTNNRSNSMESAWLKDQVERIVRGRAKCLYIESMPGQLKQSVSMKLVSAAEIENPLEEYPVTLTEMDDKAQKLMDTSRFAITQIVLSSSVKMDTRIRRMGSREPFPQWEQIIEYVQEQYKVISAAIDFSDADTADGLPLHVFDAYEELKSINYLCRIIMAVLGL